MKEQTLHLLLAALVGFIFTILTQGVLEWRKRRRIKQTIELFLKEIITPTIDILTEELKIVSKAVDKHDSGDIVTGMHPTFNAVVIKSFNMADLQAVYGKKFTYIIDIIGILENLQDRLPRKYFIEYVKRATDHVSEHQETHKDIYSDRDDHFLRCPAIQDFRRHTKEGLNHVDEILKHLNSDIVELLK